jgi:hypothetical protein
LASSRVLLDPFEDAMLSNGIKLAIWLSYADRAKAKRDVRHRPCESCGRISPILDGQIRTTVEIWPDVDEDLHRLQSSPGYLHVGHVPSKWT